MYTHTKNIKNVFFYSNHTIIEMCTWHESQQLIYSIFTVRSTYKQQHLQLSVCLDVPKVR